MATTAPSQFSLFGGSAPAKSMAPARSPRPGGYADRPGTGPEGESCGTCANCRAKRGASKTFYKCVLMLASWTGSRGTDVLLRSPACSKWSPGKPRPTGITTRNLE